MQWTSAFVSFSMIAIAGCGMPIADDPVAFVEGELILQPPITLLETAGIEDGGSTCVKLADARGRHYELYISQRIGHAHEHGHVYAFQYMEKEGSILLQQQAAIKRVLTDAGVPAEAWPAAQSSSR